MPVRTYREISGIRIKIKAFYRTIKDVALLIEKIQICSPPFVHPRHFSCQNATAPAAATFRESTPRDIGIFTV